MTDLDHDTLVSQLHTAGIKLDLARSVMDQILSSADIDADEHGHAEDVLEDATDTYRRLLTAVTGQGWREIERRIHG